MGFSLPRQVPHALTGPLLPLEGPPASLLLSILAPFLDQLPRALVPLLCSQEPLCQPASQPASRPEPLTNHATEGQQLGTWAHPQLGLVSLAANRKTQGLREL